MKAKRVLSLLLCFAMLCGLMTVTSISASAEEVDLTRKIIYDFEQDTPEVTFNGMNWAGINNENHFNGAHSFLFNNNAATWDRCWTNVLSDFGSFAWVRIAMPEDLDIQGQLGFYFYPQAHDTSNYESFGVEFADGSYYFMPYSHYGATAAWNEIGLIGQPFTNVNDHSDVITLTAENFASNAEKKVTALMILDAGTWDGSYTNIWVDDVFYEKAEEEGAPKATFDVAGVEDVVADADGNVTLPTADVEGQLFAWQTKDGALYKAGSTVTITKKTNFYAVAGEVALQTGAGIRWAERETERGIRFETYVTKSALDTIGSSSFELGALILPYADYNADITVENAAAYGALNVVDPKVYGEVGADYRYYTGVVDFEKYFAVSQSALADLKLTAVSYIKVTYADGSVGYFYDHPDAVNNVRSVAEVARAALADTEFGYTDGQIAILNLYTQYSQETNVPEYRKDKKDNPNATAEEVEFKFITDITNKVGDGFINEPMDNGDAINGYTPAGVADLYSHANFSNGMTMVFTLPQSIDNGKYKVWFNTRGSNSNRVDNVKIEVTSDAGTFVVAESQTFFSDRSSSWWVVECPNNVQIKGTATFTFTSQSESGKIALHDIVLTPAQ